MKAVGYRKPLPISDRESLLDLDLPKPRPAGRDLLVAVKAVSVNPVDVKVRAAVAPPDGEAKILGWDAAGVVEAVGPEATLFKPGDEVFYAGSIDRPGTDAEFHLVDERIVGPKPRSLGFAEAAALPLTSITAWEMLFDRFGIRQGAADAEKGRSLLIVGGAGGVGSMAVQLARQLTGLTVIATASRPETTEWVKELGAHHAVDHAKPLPEQVRSLGLDGGVDYVFATTTAGGSHFPAIAEIVAPQGKVGLIDDPPESPDIRLVKRKSVSVHWEFMFTRPVFRTADMIRQHELLAEVARLVDGGVLRTTHAETLGRIDAATLRRAHAAIETGRTRGKLVLEGF
ncbi:MAG TPA: zinc-binding alcohol dehydrogenase family protein [Stellaceae bacterium]